MKRALVVGYGSIGRRHSRILSELLQIDVTVVTKASDCPFPVCRDLTLAGDLSRFDYFVIATETVRHYQQFEMINQAVETKTIVVEKPLFETFRKVAYPINNQVFIGYNLRFHPVLTKVREIVGNAHVFSVNCMVGEYLPWWRPATDYRKCYSAYIDQGGGVLLDLSHEIDYLQWLFGTFKKCTSFTGTISNLEIKSPDLSTTIAKTSKGTIITLMMDYLSMLPYRTIQINAEGFSVIADLENSTVRKCNADKKIDEWSFTNIERDHTYLSMHKSILENDGIATTLSEGAEVMATIDMINNVNVKGLFNE